MNNITNDSDSVWGQLKEFEHYGRAGDSNDDYKVVKYSDAKTIYKSERHAAHAMIYALNNKILWNLYNPRAAVLMQMRFDGLLGFPGGLVDEGEDPVVGLNRELEEEINIDLSQHSFTEDCHLVSYYNKEKKLILHFFLMEVTLDEFHTIEKRALQAYEYGIEVNGHIRPPLFTMGDDFRGFPAFLTNNFCGNAKEELLRGLLYTGVFNEEEIQSVLKASRNHSKSLT